MDASPTPDARRGLVLGVVAYSVWGLLPLYLRLLHGMPALQILAHRIVWSFLLLAVVVVALRRTGPIRAALAARRTGWLLVGSACLIAVNWLVYIWSVMSGHVLEASLGYFIIPLVNVGLGMAVLGERLRRLQAAAIAVAAAGVAVAAVAEGGALWIPLVLAVSFGVYGLIRKVAAIDSLGGLMVETGVLAPLALGVLVWAGLQGDGEFGQSPRTDMLLIAAGPITAAPLLMFGAAARRLRLTTLGLLQYIAPSIQFLCAVLLFGETLRPAMLAAFVLIWIGCALYATDGARAARMAAPPLEV